MRLSEDSSNSNPSTNHIHNATMSPMHKPRSALEKENRRSNSNQKHSATATTTSTSSTSSTSSTRTAKNQVITITDNEDIQDDDLDVEKEELPHGQQGQQSSNNTNTNTPTNNGNKWVGIFSPVLNFLNHSNDDDNNDNNNDNNINNKQQDDDNVDIVRDRDGDVTMKTVPSTETDTNNLETTHNNKNNIHHHQNENENPTVVDVVVDGGAVGIQAHTPTNATSFSITSSHSIDATVDYEDAIDYDEYDHDKREREHAVTTSNTNTTNHHLYSHYDDHDDHNKEEDATAAEAEANTSHNYNQDDEDDDEEDEFNPYLFIKFLPPYQSVVPYPDDKICLPPKDMTDPPITLVLDLDETLVHCTVEPILDATMVFPVLFNGTQYSVHVRTRPYLQQFLESVAKKFEVVVFTASQKVYADELLNRIDPGE